MTIYLSDGIRKARYKKGTTQQELADFLGVTFQSVSRWERGDGYPDITLLPAIASYFGTTVDELLGISKAKKEQQAKAYLELYDTMKLKDLPQLFNEYKKAVKELPGDFRISVRYMQLLQEVKIRTLSMAEILSGDYIKPSQEISKIYEDIQKHCTDDSIRIRSKTIMISHLLWKYDCICNEDGKYGVYKEFLQQADDIISTLPSMCNSKEIMSFDKTECNIAGKNALEELMFLLQEKLFGYCLNYSSDKRLALFESLQNLLSLIYPDGNYGKNCYYRLYNLGHLGHLYHQSGDDKKALGHLKKAAEYAKELDKSSDAQAAKRFYNFGTVYREVTASEFMKIVMTEHYPMSEEFKSTDEFRKIIKLLG